MAITLESVELPIFGVPTERPQISPAEYEARIAALYGRAQADWLVVYGDREHFANLAFLTGYDPRFEEALLVVGPSETRHLVVGNEGLLYSDVAGLELAVLLCQSFSLLGQDRSRSANLESLLSRDIGMRSGDSVAIVGWKHLSHEEWRFGEEAAFVPAYVCKILEHVAGQSPRDVSRLMTDPKDGLRTDNSTRQIEQLEWGASRASRAVHQTITECAPGLTELEIIARAGYAGEPLSAHPMLASGSGDILGLRSPRDRVVREGDGIFIALGYWGGLTARGGLLSHGPNDDYLERVVFPYYSCISVWYETIGIDRTGGEVHDAVMESLADVDFDPLLNPGHLISLEEWVDSPVRPGSDDVLRSGMALQCDIIPYPLPAGYTTNCEDTIVLADADLQTRIRKEAPDLWSRAMARREFMRLDLGLEVGDEVLPLSSTPGYLPPFWLRPDVACKVV